MVEWISHRGLRVGCSENSQTAFDFAINAGFRWLETDLRCSSDGHVVLAHDASLLRVFGKEMMVENTPLRELELWSDPFNQKILSFNDFIKRYEQANWVLDIKEESAEKTLYTLSKSPFFSTIQERLPHRIKFLFWSGKTERKFLRVFPGADTFAREMHCWRAGLFAMAGLPVFAGIIPGKTYALPPFFLGRSLYNQRVFSGYKRNGAKVLAYLPDTRDLCLQAIDCGTDYVLSNEDFFNKS